MKIRSCLSSLTLVIAAAFGCAAQQPANNVAAPYDDGANVNENVARIAVSVQSLTKTLRDFVDKFAKADGLTLGEKQQRLVVGMQLLVQNEQRLATQQKFQIELAEKESQIRARLAQIDIELNPQSIDRSVAFEGSTQTPEIKENRRRVLAAERAGLSIVQQQIQSSLQDATSSVRETLGLVNRLRRAFLPQVERELADQ